MELKKALQEKTIEVPFGDETLTVTYRPEALTPAMLVAMDEAKTTKQQMDVVAGLLAEMVASWDLTVGGEPYPLEKDALLQLPLGFLNTVFQALTEAERPKDGKSAT